VHEEVVLRVVSLPLNLDHPGRHGIRGYACRTDHGIDLPAREDLHDLTEHDARRRVNADGGESKAKDDKALDPEEDLPLHGSPDCEADKHGHNVGNPVL
jgi:hypothetical protein